MHNTMGVGQRDREAGPANKARLYDFPGSHTPASGWAEYFFTHNIQWNMNIEDYLRAA